MAAIRRNGKKIIEGAKVDKAVIDAASRLGIEDLSPSASITDYVTLSAINAAKGENSAIGALERKNILQLSNKL